MGSGNGDSVKEMVRELRHEVAVLDGKVDIIGLQIAEKATIGDVRKQSHRIANLEARVPLSDYLAGEFRDLKKDVQDARISIAKLTVVSLVSAAGGGSIVVGLAKVLGL